MSYRAGDHNVICDRCGFKFHSSQTRKTWDNLIVCLEDFETRHPQDFVRGRKDRQNVIDPRPEALDNFVGPLLTSIATAASAGATVIDVSSSVRFLPGDHIGVLVNSGDTERHIVMSIPSATSIEMTLPLGDSVSVGNVVIDYSAVSLPDIG